MKNRTIIILGVAAAAAAFLAGLGIRESGIYPPAPGPVSTTDPRMDLPTPEYKTSGTQAASSASTAYAWYTGWRWPNYGTGTSVCFDSSIPGAPLSAVAQDFRTIDPRLKISAYSGAGQCAAHGFPHNRRLTFAAFTTHDKAANPNVCGMTISGNYGPYAYAPNDAYLRQLPMIKINVTGTKTTPCGASEWTDVFKHEYGHAWGLSHSQPRVTSIMRDGHLLDAYDKYYIRMIMFGDARGVRVVA
jgi:hypothetical protein